MIEADNQDELNDFLQGSIDAEDLDSLARLWPNYDTDYAPLVEFAKENGITFVATNIPRRFAHMVYKNGGFSALDSLSVEEKSWVAPLPIQFDANLPQYQKILEMMQDHATPELVQAQAIKDATMAYFIVMNLREQHTFIHLNGAFHSDFHEGILWYVHLQRPEINAITISTVEQEDISSLNEEHIGRADFIICVDKDMTKTY